MKMTFRWYGTDDPVSLEYKKVPVHPEPFLILDYARFNYVAQPGDGVMIYRSEKYGRLKRLKS